MPPPAADSSALHEDWHFSTQITQSRRQQILKVESFSGPSDSAAAVVGKDSGTYPYDSCWSPDSKWISYFAEEVVKVQPEGILWELAIDEALAKLAK